MKINAFQIRNYRSIVDTGKCYLSYDNITALIGQNESGKTSVLEALRSFYKGQITDDVLRSDQSFPEIACVFEHETEKIEKIVDMGRIPEALREYLLTKTELTIVRKWTDARKNLIYISEPEISLFFDTLRQRFEETDAHIIESIPELQREADDLQGQLATEQAAIHEVKAELNKAFATLEQLKRFLGKAKRPDMQIETQLEFESSQQKYSHAEENLTKKLAYIEQIRLRWQEATGKLERCLKYNDIAARVAKLRDDGLVMARQIQDTEHNYELCSSEKEGRNIWKRLENLKKSSDQMAAELKELTAQWHMQNKTTGKILRGMSFQDAETEALAEKTREEGYLTPEEIAKALFKYLPVFEFFEDFSSLLPNKIDLEDLLNENEHAEGYKAARNFLSVAGLNADFFREKNHRILKQKIENLNTDITVNFQDYWCQHVGHNDKIRINFELEHYDYTVPEKSGKPYLEFWIKDKQERLYPKQRSRGVRWFLSFYLELKATAIEQHQNRVLLIDEPGLSLHARAQEDVLKVFEDLRENLQIIYCTHSPHLIDLHKLYRIMAVQRANDADENSETVVMDARSLNEASSDTLSPIYTLMGTRLNDKQFIFSNNNVIVEDTITFYYFDAILRMANPQNPSHIIPASGFESIPLMANLLFGWKIDFGLLVFDVPETHHVAEHLKKSLFIQRKEASDKKIRLLEGFASVEDLFSTIDFKRFILNERVGITMKNSEYIRDNKLSRTILASEFCTRIEKEGIVMDRFDEETRANFNVLFAILAEMNA
jgi:predicted ATP-dependent endonuclease of OLD family